MDIEIHLMHQEDTIQQLNDVVIRQQHLIDALRSEVDSIKEQLHGLAAVTTGIPVEEEPPPHY